MEIPEHFYTQYNRKLNMEYDFTFLLMSQATLHLFYIYQKLVDLSQVGHVEQISVFVTQELRWGGDSVSFRLRIS